MKSVLWPYVLVFGFSSPALASETEDHTGFNMAVNTGYHEVRGSYFENDVGAGPALKLDLGWRILPLFSLESGLTYAGGPSKALHSDVRFLHTLNLDARLFPLGARMLEPNVLVGWTLNSSAHAPGGGAPSIEFRLHGYSPTVGAGARIQNDQYYFQADLRYVFTRYTAKTTDTEAGRNTTSLREEHGDAFMVLFGVGVLIGGTSEK